MRLCGSASSIDSTDSEGFRRDVQHPGWEHRYLAPDSVVYSAFRCWGVDALREQSQKEPQGCIFGRGPCDPMGLFPEPHGRCWGSVSLF